MHASKGSNSSFVWRSIHEARLVLHEGCRWRVGDGSQIPIFGEKWTSNLQPILPTDSTQFNPFMRVADLIEPTSKTWRIDVTHSLFNPQVADVIINTPLFQVITDDMLVWSPEKSGVYSVRSAYRLLLNNVLQTDHLQVAGNWRSIWKLNIPPKVKHFLWRLCRNVLPVRSNLTHRHINVVDNCPWCTGVVETEHHLFISCPKAAACWNVLGISIIINNLVSGSVTFADFFFSVMEALRNDLKIGFCMTLWSLWQARNDLVWNNKKLDSSGIIWAGSSFFNDWSHARGLSSLDGLRDEAGPSAVVDSWRKPMAGCVKCNIDASFSLTENRVGIGLCLRDDRGNFIRARTHSFTPLLDVLVGETLGLHLAITWVRELGFTDVIFELDAKMVVDSFNSNKVIVSEFGCLLSACKSLFHFFSNNSHVEFTRRNANKVAHTLAGVALFTASPQDYFDVPTCITDLIINELH